MFRIFDSQQASSLRALAPPDDCEESRRLRYLAELLVHGPSGFVEAADLERLVLVPEHDPARAVPVVVNDDRDRNCYILSPRVHYVDYMRYELDKMKGNTPARVLSGAVGLLGALGGPLGFNRCVSVNNWLFTTNPSYTPAAEELRALVDVLTRRFPTMPLVFRSVDARAQATRDLYTRAGFRLVVNRPVLEWRADHEPTWSRKVRKRVRSESRLPDQLGWERDAVLRPGDAARMAALYRALYLEKHSGYNARFTEPFFRAVSESGIMRFVLFRHEGEIAGFVSYTTEPSRMVAALVGYDQSLDRKEYPLYRAAVAAMIRIAGERRRTLFLSTGVTEFKRRRGAYEWFEHEAVYDRHLPAPKRVPWWSMGTLLDLTVAKLDTGKM